MNTQYMQSKLIFIEPIETKSFSSIFDVEKYFNNLLRMEA